MPKSNKGEDILQPRTGRGKWDHCFPAASSWYVSCPGNTSFSIIL